MKRIQRIGVFDSPHSMTSPTVKHALLYCDKLAVANLDGLLAKQLEHIENDQRAMLDFLQNSDFLRVIEVKGTDYNRVLQTIPRQPKPFTHEEAREYFGSAIGSSLGRLASSVLRESLSAESIAVPFYQSFEAYRQEFREDEKGESCLRLILNSFPIPGETMSVQDILDFRNDPSNVSKRDALFAWQDRVVREGATVSELVDQLASLLNDYGQYMKIHKERFVYNSIEIILKLPFQVIENLVKLKLSETISRLFALKQESLNFRESELSAPGREIAYIAEAQRVVRE